jgi:hypothetical protein
MADGGDPGAILRRALAYPYATPDRSYLYLDGRATELPAAGPDLSGRSPLLAYGANAAPEALARKLAALPGVPLPVLRAELAGHDVVYSAHVSPYGAVPATLLASAGTSAPVFVAYPTPEQLTLIDRGEPNYEPTQLEAVCRLEDGSQLAAARAYLSRHGPLSLDGSPVSLAAVRSSGRRLPELDEPAVLERVHAALAPELGLEAFARDCVERGGLAPLPSLS